jgi:2-polyprenyl-6-methoxyphenol hydroxylase-like FAD-dependent oxidoreductase
VNESCLTGGIEMEATHQTDVVIVGAGIAGLTAAIALDRAGISVQIVERAGALTQAGTALSLWPNALAALDRIDLSGPIVDIGYEESSGTVRNWSGREIIRIDQSRLSQRVGSTTLTVHRGELQRVLLDAASHLPILLHSPVERMGSDGSQGIAELSTGKQLRASVVLACDGVRSVARSLTDNPPPRYTGRTSWRAVLSGASHLVTEACLSAGRGKQFIASPLRGNLTYWAADVAMPEGANEALPDKKAFLLESFAGWHHPVVELIERTDGAWLVTADIYDAVPRVLTAGRVALLGDAAHPMTPDLGQGACQGIEDGVVIAACMTMAPNPEIALANYQSARIHRVQRMVKDSRHLGALATAESRIGSSIRNAVGALMPGWINRGITARYASEAAFLRTLPGQLIP